MKHLLWLLIGGALYACAALLAITVNANMQGHGPVGAGMGLVFLFLIAIAFVVGALVGGVASVRVKDPRRELKILILLVIGMVPGFAVIVSI